MRYIEQFEFNDLKETYAQLLSNNYEEEEGIEVDVDDIIAELSDAPKEVLVNQIENSDYSYLLHPFKYSR
jgi:hypothetical protein